MNRVGRPRDEIEPAKALITRRVRELVNEAHGGNVLEASNVTGVPAATLRALFNGKSTNPGLKTLTALAEPYGLTPGWFSEEGTHTSIRHGLDLAIGERQKDGSFYSEHNVGLPWSSWPLPSVYWKLREYVVGKEGSDRPIIGKLDPQDPTLRSDIDSAVAQFLLEPLLKADKTFELSLLPNHSRDTSDPAKVQRLKSLGQFWQDVLGPLLDTKGSD